LRSDRWLYALLSPDDNQDAWDIGMSVLLDYQQYTQRKDDNETALAQLLDKNESKNYPLIYNGKAIASK
jgi:hypothetical protein